MKTIQAIIDKWTKQLESVESAIEFATTPYGGSPDGCCVRPAGFDMRDMRRRAAFYRQVIEDLESLIAE